MTRESGYTAGPWAVAEEDDRTIIYLPASYLGNHIAIMSNGGVPEEQERANARLIAAAPTLLEALYPDELEAIADEIQCFEHSARAASLRAIAKWQRQAISAATGQAGEAGQ